MNIKNRETQFLKDWYSNLKTTQQVVGFLSAYDSEVMVEIEIELAKRGEQV